MERPSRKNIRLANWDYANQSYYHVTICTHERIPILSSINPTTHEVKLSDIGICVNTALGEALKRYPSFRVETYVIMPNHLHLLVAIDEKTVPLSRFIGYMKSYATRQVRKMYPGCILWQSRFYDHILRSEKDYHDTWKYIADNPAKWAKDDYYVAQLRENGY